jgi:hypothetical protein
MRAKLADVNDQLKQRRHLPIPEQGRWLGSVVRGHHAYYAVPATATPQKPSGPGSSSIGTTRSGAAASATPLPGTGRAA